MSESEYKKIFSNNLKYYMDLNKKNQMDLVNDLTLSQSTVSNWCTGLKLPRMNKIQMLADYFGIEKSDLLEKHEFHKPSLSETEKLHDSITKTFGTNAPRLLNFYNQLNSKGKNEALKRVQELSYISIYTEPEHLTLSAAHERTDIEVTNEMKQHDDDLMMDDEFWK